MHWYPLLPLLPLLLLASCKVAGREAEGNLNAAAAPNRASFYLGSRAFDEDDWRPVGEQGVFGAEFAHRVSTVGWEVGVLGSRDETRSGGQKVEGTTNELYGGLRLEFGDQVVRPYLGVGVTLLGTKLDVQGGPDDDDGSVGAYGHVGFTVDVFPRAYVGLDARGVIASDVELNGVSRDTDYGQIALVLGFAF